MGFSAWADGGVREKLAELHKLRTEIRSVVFEKSRLQDELARVQIEMDKQNERIQQLKFDQQELKAKILSRARGLYKLHRLQPQGSVLQLLGSHDFLKKSFYLQYLNQQDKRLVTEFAEKNKSLTKEQAQYRRRAQYYKKMASKVKTRHFDLLAQEKDQRRLIETIRQQMNPHQAPQSGQTFFSELRGQLPRPLEGVARNHFGLKRDARTDLATVNTGLYLIAQEGTEIRSVAAGEVVFLEEIAGWGLTLILDHGEHYYTVYSHIKDPSVRLGEKVIGNQILAVLGRPPYDNTQALYFEIRHFSEPQDPREWIERGTF